MSREMQAAENERAVIEAYLEEHQLDAALNDAVNAIVKARRGALTTRAAVPVFTPLSSLSRSRARRTRSSSSRRR